ncbi:MAG: glk [Sphingomonas bacterium]|nr:glk [Sphingomonas bacterium]
MNLSVDSLVEEIVVADIGGTHARFALARVSGGRVLALDAEETLKTAAFASLATAWQGYANRVLQAQKRALPRAAGIAIASPIDGAQLKLTNSPWVIPRATLAADLGLDRHVLVNDFGAVAHAVAHVGPEHMRAICGPDRDLPAGGVISIVGPGTGLGVAQLRRAGDGYVVGETEGGHIDFAPLDGFEDAMLARLRERFRRVSVERIVAGPGLANIHEALAATEGRAVRIGDDAALWSAAIARSDGLAAAALDRFCRCLGSVAGDIALAQGAVGLVIAGGIGLRLADILPTSGFGDRFAAKGRFERRMAAIPVKLLAHPQPGLFGAAAAYAQAHR